MEEQDGPGTTLRSSLISSSEKGYVFAGEAVEDSCESNVVFEEVKRQLWLSGPLISVSLLQMCLQVISVMFVGHLGELALSGAAMATSFAGVTGFSFLRGMFVLLLVSVPLATIWGYTGFILLSIGQDPEIAAQAGLYARWMIPSIFAYGLLQCLVRFLQAQNIVFPMMISSGMTALVHILLCWILVFESGLGFKGAALANSISYWANVLLLALYVKFSPACKKTWTGLSKESLHDVFHFIQLAVPSAVMVCLEFWSFEFLVLLSGLLPNPKLETSVLSISLNTASLAFMIPFGLGGAVSTRVSNELGARRPQAAKLAVRVVLGLAITFGLVVGTTMILVRKVWGYAYSSEEEVVSYVAVMMPILATSNFLDGIQCVLSGTCRGCGWQKIGAFVNLGAYYIAGIPSAILLAFVLHIGGKGLWMGIICGLLVQVSLLLTVTLRTNWEQEARKARDRVYSSSLPVDMAQ
ncbi:protein DETOXIFICATION 16-like isoform X2 [Aristolochia californica]|uniref:protein DETOXIFICATION 16-like isoform X2 n=1 Tax=Aristolochia californica TaxID=171875 RepID=UPI0035DCBF4B